MKKNYFLETYNGNYADPAEVKAFYSKKKLRRKKNDVITENDDQPEKVIFQEALEVVNSVEKVLTFLDSL